VVEQEGRPIGWIQWYLWADYPEHAQQLEAAPFSAGIDLAIGEVKMTGLGLGPVAIREATKQLVFVNPLFAPSLPILRKAISDLCGPSKGLASGW